MKKDIMNLPNEYIDACETIREDLRREYSSDPIALLEELPDLLNLQISEQMESMERRKESDELVQMLKDFKMDFSDRDAIISQVNCCEAAAEADGYRRGFRMAMRLCVAGLGG